MQSWREKNDQKEEKTPDNLDSIALSVFVVILVEFDKYRIWDEQACLR